MKIVPDQCQVSQALDIIVGKWKLLILLHLLANGTTRFGEFQRAIPSITPKVLTQQLRELEEEEIIERHIYPQIPPKVEYTISAYGTTLEPILNAMHTWGLNHLNHKQSKHEGLAGR
ncbi:winged helix-turn-helix transcriptional regulator [Shouchella sp. JSM 1781072]|uniref:winged helix-turn-helix transcriptional regulator n=1 Tax=Shouchella sp. JSM 1781072 TaxID=3344581 RepID=UPI0035C09953